MDGGGATRITTLVNAADAKFMNAVDLTGNTLFTGGDVLFAGSLNSHGGSIWSGVRGPGRRRDAEPEQRRADHARWRTCSHVNSNVGGDVKTSGQQKYDKALNVTGPADFTAGGGFEVDGRTTLAG